MEKILAEAKAMSEREEKFEKMLRDARKQYAEICAKMEKLRAEDRTKSAAFRELLANKLFLQNLLSMYRAYGLTEESKSGI